MTEKSRDPYDGELANDADLDATGTDAEAEPGDGDVEQSRESVATTDRTTLP